MQRFGRQPVVAMLLAIALFAVACGGEAADDPTDDGATADPVEDGTDEEEPAEDGGEAAEEPSGETVDVTLYTPLPVMTIAMFAPVMANSLGFFEDENLQVEVIGADSGSLAVQQMASGNGEAGLLLSGTALNAIAQGQDLVAVHDFITRPMADLMVPVDSELETYEDLDGATIGVDGLDAGEVPELRGDLSLVGLSENEDYTFTALGDNHAIAFEQVMSGRADALSLNYNERVTLENEGYEMRALEVPYESDAVRPTVPLTVTREFFEDNREAVVGLGRAMNRAVVYAHANPDAALALMREAFPPEHEDPEFARTYMEAALNFSDPDEPGFEGRFGQMPMAGWEELASVLLEDDASVDLEAHVTNDLIDEMNDFDREATEQLAEESELTYP